MSTNTKFLSDGRKVAIVGKLNNTEWIVQEIFVTKKGDEIPSGESFTAKSLHDAPVESYLKKEERRQKENTERAKAELESVRRSIKEATDKLKAKQAMLANSPELKDLVGDKARILSMFMTGTVEYLVIDRYTLSKPVRLEDQIIQWETGWGETRFDGLKLLSVLGKSKGEVEYRINQYSDGSGSGGFQVWPFETHEEAVDKIKEIAINQIEKGSFNWDSFDVCQELGIQFSKEHQDKIIEIFSKSIKNGLDYAEKHLKDYSKQHEELTAKLANLKDKVQGKAA